MKTTDEIPLRTTVRAIDGKTGKQVTVAETRTVQEQIEQHRYRGEHDAADRLESSCDDTHLDVGRYVEVDPTNSGAKSEEPVAKKR